MKSAATTTPVTPFTQNNNQQKQTAKEAIAANVQALIEQLEQGHSDALTAYLTAMGRFHNYSFGNILEIARQKPDATRVAGLYAWNQLGRRVKKGERGIRILAPVIGVRRKKDEEAEKDIRTQNEAVVCGFRSAYAFDRCEPDRRQGASRIHRTSLRQRRRVPRTARVSCFAMWRTMTLRTSGLNAANWRRIPRLARRSSSRFASESKKWWSGIIRELPLRPPSSLCSSL